MKYVIVRDNTVENMVDLDPSMLVAVESRRESGLPGYPDYVPAQRGRRAWVPPEGTTMHEANGVRVEVGWAWNSGAPVDPAASAEVLLARGKGIRLAEVASALETAASVGVTYDGAVYQIDATSQQRIQARAIYARACIDGSEEWPQDYGWIAMDNSRPIFTAEEFWEFAIAVHDRVTAITLHARSLKDQILAASSLQQLRAINPNAGW